MGHSEPILEFVSSSIRRGGVDKCLGVTTEVLTSLFIEVAWFCIPIDQALGVLTPNDMLLNTGGINLPQCLNDFYLLISDTLCLE